MSLRKPPAATMRSRSRVWAGLWSCDSGTAVAPRHSTALESPALATNRRSPCRMATRAVHPAWMRISGTSSSSSSAAGGSTAGGAGGAGAAGAAGASSAPSGPSAPL